VLGHRRVRKRSDSLDSSRTVVVDVEEEAGKVDAMGGALEKSPMEAAEIFAGEEVETVVNSEVSVLEVDLSGCITVD